MFGYLVLSRATSWNSVILSVFSKSGYSVILYLPVHSALPPRPMVLLMWSLTKQSLAQSALSKESLPFSRPSPWSLFPYLIQFSGLDRSWLSQLAPVSLIWCLELFYSKSRISHFPLFKVKRLLLAYFSSPWQSLWMTILYQYSHQLCQQLLSLCVSQHAEDRLWLTSDSCRD